jgi:hypothetical protein
MYVESISGAVGETLDLRARSIKTLVAIAIEHTEYRVVATLVRGPLFSTLDDTNESGALCVVRHHHLGRGQLEVYAFSFEVPLFRLTLAHNQRNRARLALAGASPKRRLAAYFGNMTTGHALTVELSNHGNRPVAPLHVAPFQCLVLGRPVVEQRVQMGRLRGVLFDEPNLVAAQEIYIEQRRVMRREDQLSTLRILVPAEQSNEKTGDVGVKAPVEFVDEERCADGQEHATNRQ